MTKYLLALALLLPGAAEAACPLGGSPLYLEIPAIGNSADWAPCIRRDLLKLSTSTVLNYKGDFQSTSTTAGHKFVRFLSSSGLELGSINSAGLLAWTYGVSVGTITASGNIIGGDDLSITDQGVFGGTLTVKGANGLTASSGAFTGTGASSPFVITASSGIRMNSGAFEMGTGGFLRFPDGSTQLTAPSAGTSVLAQSTICVTNSLVTASTVMPHDDTIPQNTEGTEVLTCAFTPTSGSNRLRVTATGWFCTPSTGYKSGAIFRDTTANAIKAANLGGYPADSCENFTIVAEDNAVAASATTYKLRIGPSSALNIYVNGISAARLFGGVGGTSIQIDEIVP